MPTLSYNRYFKKSYYWRDLLCSHDELHFHCFFFCNSQFLSKVDEKFPKDTDLIVACQKGLRCALCSTNCSFGYNFGLIMRNVEVLL